MKKPQLSDSTIKTIQTIHFFLLFGQVAFALLMIFTQQNDDPSVVGADNTFLTILSVLALSGYLIGRLIYKRLIEKAVSKESIQERIKGYQSALIIRMALMEGPSLLGLVFFSMTNNPVFLAISGLIIAYFISLRPSRDKIEDELNLTNHQKRLF